MQEIYLAHNPLFTIPAWQFLGACMGLDIRRVVETGITPLINTGIAHREPGIGQIGAGTVRAPLACFEQGLEYWPGSWVFMWHNRRSRPWP